MPKRSGGKFGGDHTTFIDLAADMADLAAALPEVQKISAGFIQSGQSVAGGERRVKFVDVSGGLLLKVRQNRSVQEVRVITTNPQRTRLALARAARDRDIGINFRKEAGMCSA